MSDAIKRSVRIIAFQEGDVWVAQCVEHDICVQGKDLPQARRRMEVALEIELEQSTANGGEPFNDIDPAPAHYAFMFDEATDEAALAGDVEMRIAA